jgi:hypothetical protein
MTDLDNEPWRGAEARVGTAFPAKCTVQRAIGIGGATPTVGATMCMLFSGVVGDEDLGTIAV